MMFHEDGSASAAGWTFHGAAPEYVVLSGVSRDTARADVGQSQFQGTGISPREGVLNAVRDTAVRHQGNSALRAAGLNAPEWQALFRSLIQAESAFNPSARSPKGAIGLGQLMPDTARALGVNPHDLTQNLDGAARYFLAQLSKFGSVELALAAYNAGPHRIEEHRGVPPFRETRAYIARINRLSGGLVTRQVAAASTATLTRNNTPSAVVLE